MVLSSLLSCPLQGFLNWFSGGTRAGAQGAPLFLDQTEAWRAETVFLETDPHLSQGLDDRPPPPSPIISQSRDTALGLEVWRTVTGEVPSPEKKQQNRLINLKLVKRSQTRQTRHYSSGLFWEERIVWRFWRTEKNSWEPVIIYRLGAGGGGWRRKIWG